MTTLRAMQDHKPGFIRRHASARLVAVCLATLAALNGCGGGDAPEPELWSKTIERAAAQAEGRPDVSSVVTDTKDIKPAIAPPGQTDSAHGTKRAAATQSSSSCYPPHQYETVYSYWVVVENGSIPTNGISILGSYTKPTFPAISAPVPGAGAYCPSGASYYDAMVGYQIEMQIREEELKQAGAGYQAAMEATTHAWEALSILWLSCAGGPGGRPPPSACPSPHWSVQAFSGQGTSLQEMVNSGRYSMVFNRQY